MIPRTNLHKGRIVEQARMMLLNLQRSMRANAEAHRAMALAQSPDFSTLKGFVESCAATYLLNLQRLVELRSDPEKRQRFADALTQIGWTESDILDVATPLRQAAVALRDAPRANYADIVSSSDSLLQFVDAPETLWPE